MKRIYYFYWVLALAGFVLPVSTTIMMQLPALFSSVFVYLLSFGFKTNEILSLSEMCLLSLSLVALCFYLYQLISLSIEATKKAKIGYAIATFVYSGAGSVYLFLMKPSVVTSILIVSYFVLLCASTYLLKRISQ